MFLYPGPVILTFSLLRYWSMENCTAILSKASTLLKFYLCNTAFIKYRGGGIELSFKLLVLIIREPVKFFMMFFFFDLSKKRSQLK